MSTQPYLVIRADDIEPYTHPHELGYHSQHILGRESVGRHDLLVNQGVVDPHYALGGTNHPDNDEIYYAVSGSSLVDMGGHPDTGEGSRTFRLDQGGLVFVPAGVFHRLHNESDEPFVLLTIWPQPSVRGANGIHDARLDDWGTGFKLRDGCRLVEDGDGRHVVSDAAGGGPIDTGAAGAGG